MIKLSDIIKATVTYGVEHWIGRGDDAYLDDVFMMDWEFEGTPMKLMNFVSGLIADGYVNVSIKNIEKIA